jgi:hypothetical protein
LVASGAAASFSAAASSSCSSCWRGGSGITHV